MHSDMRVAAGDATAVAGDATAVAGDATAVAALLQLCCSSVAALLQLLQAMPLRAPRLLCVLRL
jgi:hypothetical protein